LVFVQVDFGIWTPDQKQVAKEKVASRILSVSWSSDGNFLALGLLSGLISVRNQKAEELLKIERKAPVWCLAFVPESSAPSRSQSTGGQASASAAFDHADLLAVGSWEKTYSLYK
jgi:intraflagellar transport protein 122